MLVLCDKSARSKRIQPDPKRDNVGRTGTSRLGLPATMFHSPCVITSIPAGFHFVFPFHPLTHIDPRLITGIVPSPSPNLTPERT